MSLYEAQNQAAVFVVELWIQFNTSDASVRYYNMHFIQICYASAPDTVLTFFLAVLRIIRWARSIVLDNVMKKLLGVEKAFEGIAK